MSSGDQPTSAFISPKEYEENQAKIAAAQKYLESLTSKNEIGLRRFQELEAQKRELQRKIEEGEQAKRAMEQLRNLQTNVTRGLLEGPRQESYQSTARIEEVPPESPAHHSTASHSSYAQRNPPTPVLPLPQVADKYADVGHSQPNLPSGSGTSFSGAQRDGVPMHSFGGQQGVYPPPTVILPEAPPSVQSTEAATFLSQSRHPTQYQSFYQPQEPPNTNSYYRGQPIPHTNAGPSNYQNQVGTSSAYQSRWPYNNPEQIVSSFYPPPSHGQGKPLELIWDKDNSTDVRFLNIQISDIPVLKSKITEFALTAPPQTRNVIHPDMAVWKDENSVIWLYIRVDGGFWRYRDIHRFFEGQIRMTQSRSWQPLQKQSTMEGRTSYGKEPAVQDPHKRNGPHPVYLPPTTVGVERPPSSSIAQPPPNRLVPSGDPQHIVAKRLSSSSALHQTIGQATLAETSGGASIVPIPSQTPVIEGSGLHNRADAVTSASIATASSKPTSSQPPIDKKNLSKHILFALGKRPRDILQRSPEAGSPAKKPSLGTFTVAQTSKVGSTVQSVAVPSTVSLDISQSTKPTTNAITFINATTHHPVSNTTPITIPTKQSSFMETSITKPQATSGGTDTPPILKPSPTPVPTPLVNPPTQVNTVSPPNATSPPLVSVPSVPAPIPQTTSCNTDEHLVASQRALVVAPNKVPLPPQYRPHFAGGPQISQSSSLLPVAPIAQGGAVMPQEPGQVGVASIHKESPPGSAVTAITVVSQEPNRPDQQHPRKESTSIAPKQNTQRKNIQQNAEAGPSNVGTLRQPFRLPSAGPSSTSHSTTPQAQSKPADSKAVGKRRNRAYVLAPPRPPYLVAHKRRLAEKRAAHLLGEEGAKAVASSWEKGPGDTYDEPLIIGEDYSSGRNTPVDAFEQESLRLSVTRVDVFPCRWDRCDVVLNCAESLLKHLNQHPPEPSPNNRSYTCRWTQCGRRCTYAEKHLENHAYLPLRCAYKNCSETYRSATQLAKHFHSKHRDHALKPAAGLQQPGRKQLPDVPGVVPAYLFVTKHVKPATISKNRHGQLVPNVVTSIVDSDPERPVKLRARKAVRSTGRQLFPPDDTVRNEYDFMTARSIRYSSYLSQPVDLPLSDLDSTNISELLDEGLMLWTPDGDLDNGDDGGDDVMFDRGDIKIEDDLQPGLESNAVSSISDRGHIEQRIDEEQMVENMLTQASG